MANKRVADILARTYFSGGEGNSVGRSTEIVGQHKYFNLNVPLIVLNIILLCLLIIGWKTGFFIRHEHIPNSVVQSQAIRINPSSVPISITFDFSNPNAGDTIEYYLNLKGVDASQFSSLAFDVRFSSGENHSIRVEFVNQFREVGEVGIPSLGTKWKEVVIPLSEVSKITSWNDVKQIGFILDEWNVSVPKGTVYIDNIRFIEGT